MSSPTLPAAGLVAAYSINFDASTGPFLGFATLVEGSLAALHPGADRALLASSPTSQVRLRLQISVSGADTALVADGTVRLGAETNGVRIPPAVSLEWSVQALPDRDYSSLSAADLVEVLEEAGRLDPTRTPSDPPDPPGLYGEPGVHGWWCRAWPSCPGC